MNVPPPVIGGRHGDASAGGYTLNSGTLTSGNTRIAIGGLFSSGTFTQSGGSHHVGGSLLVGDARYGIGSYVMTGGTVDVASSYVPDGITFDSTGTTVGGSGIGVFNQSGGTHITGQLIVGSNIAAASGVYALSGTGALVAGSIGHGNGTQAVTPGSFNFNGRRLSVITFHGDLLNNGGTLAPAVC